MNAVQANAVDPLSRIRIVLVQPSHPGNIGAAARALKNMGLSRLVLVRPRIFPDAAAGALAANAIDVLESARVCDSLDEALEGTVLAIAMSARGRDLSHPALAVREAAVQVMRCAMRDEAALVFGNETAGLSNQEVMKCAGLAHIPAHPGYVSLNLAQAVQVVAYELWLAAIAPVTAQMEATEYARHEDIENFYEHLERNLRESGFLHPQHPRRLMERLRRLFTRARLEKEEVNILRGILTAWDERGRGGK